MALLAAVILICLYGFQTASNVQQNCYFSFINGIIRAGLPNKSAVAGSLLDCAISRCGCKRDCLGSYNSNSEACITVTLNAALLGWLGDALIIKSDDSDWVSFAPVSSFATLATPACVWLMDDSFRGLNLGSKGPRLDSSDTGLQWIGKGPRGSASSLKYAYFDGHQKAKIQVRYSDKYLLDFTEPFSIALWIKTDNSLGERPLLDGWNSDANTYAAQFWFYPSTGLDEIYFRANSVLKSKKNDTGKLMWRHLAVIFAGSDDYTFYLNGSVWPISLKTSGGLMRVNPDLINIGHRSDNVFKGSMACIAIFEQALTQAEVYRWMLDCPETN